MVRAGFHGGDWLGAGIVSSTAGNNYWIYALGSPTTLASVTRASAGTQA
jgi:hypothetical protein